MVSGEAITCEIPFLFISSKWNRNSRRVRTVFSFHSMQNGKKKCSHGNLCLGSIAIAIEWIAGFSSFSYFVRNRFFFMLINIELLRASLWINDCHVILHFFSPSYEAFLLLNSSRYEIIFFFYFRMTNFSWIFLQKSFRRKLISIELFHILIWTQMGNLILIVQKKMTQPKRTRNKNL